MAMGLFSRKNKKTLETDPALLAKLDGKLIRYVTRRGMDEKGNPTETVLGKEGRIAFHQETIAVSCGGTDVFRCPLEVAKCGELMSLEGVVISGPNELTGGPDTVVAYYKYYR